MVIVTLAIGIITILITIVIAYNQARQMKRAKVIIDETKSITKKLATESYIKEKANIFFQLDESQKIHKHRYKVVYPVTYNGKPLPMIYQGDFYAIHILSIALEIEKISFLEIDRNKGQDKEYIENISLKGNVIFICTPQVNHALNQVYPFAIASKEEYKDGEKNYNSISSSKYHCRNQEDKKKWLKDINLPCWFLSEYQHQPEDIDKHRFSRFELTLNNYMV